MTRKRLTLDLLLQRLRRACGTSRRRFVMMNLDELDPMPLGPGWFDSSWELEHGLEVCENDAADIVFQPWREPVQQHQPVRVPVLALARVSSASADNLIEFELADSSAWRLPAKPSHAPRPAELELAFA